jgi:hypothetical protein
VFTLYFMDTATKRAWEGLVNYANGVATDAEVWATVAACMGWISAVESYGILGWIGNNSLPDHVAEYRPAVNILLRFLCSAPKSPERDSLRAQAVSLLREHGQHIAGMHLVEVSHKKQLEKSLQHFNYPAAELERFTEEADVIWNSAKYSVRGGMAGTVLLPLDIRVPAKDYQDLADPICDFLMSEYLRYLNRHLNRQYSRRDKKPAPVVPIFVCPKCDKLVMPKRTGRKKYCSVCTDRARAEKYRQNAPAAEGRDYQWLYRLRQKEPALRRIVLRNAKNQMRLKQVKSRQKESSRCQRLILEMHLSSA